MAKKQPMTQGETLFEEYLLGQGVVFEYEPTLGKKQPDYLIRTQPEILAEVKDLGFGILDKSVSSQLAENKIAEWSNTAIYDRARGRIQKAVKQLTEYKGKYPCVVVLHKSTDDITSDLDVETLLGAMYGDIESVWKRKETGKYEMTSQFKTTTGILKPKTNTTIGAVAILENVQPFKDIVYKPLAEYFKINSPTVHGDAALEGARKLQDKIISEHPDKDLYAKYPRLIVIHNRYAALPLPQGTFRGEYDEEICFNQTSGTFQKRPLPLVEKQ